MLASGDLDFSFSGLKTAVLTLVKNEQPASPADLARAFVDAIVEVLVAKARARCESTGLDAAGGRRRRRRQPAAARRARRASGARGFEVFYPELELCTDNGAMIAFAAALRIEDERRSRIGASASGRAGIWTALGLLLRRARPRCPRARR